VGWHIIKVDGKRAFQMPSLEEQRQNLQSFLKQQRAREYVKSLRDAAEVK
jgi:parvulin-like peptidyl-prolyl isomerase